jgi:hypothetical protein
MSLYSIRRFIAKDRAAGRSYFQYTLPKQALRGVVVGAAIGAGLTVLRVSDQDEDAVVDRCVLLNRMVL